jgi:HNH endonuclease
MTDSGFVEGRPPIPADIRRRVLVEAGHRCAIPTCRYIEVDVHHVVPWAQCQSHEYDNLIALCPNCHRRADRGEIDRKSLRLYKFNLRFAHDKYSQIEMDILFELFRIPVNEGMPWLGFNLILLK